MESLSLVRRVAIIAATLLGTAVWWANFAWCEAAVAAAAPVAPLGDLDGVLAKAMQGTKVPAMGVLVMRDDKVAGVAVRGVRRNDATDPVRIGDVWHIGSDGKAMTVTMIARLMDRGVLSWTTPLEILLPDQAATMNPQYRKVTLVQLLSHHTGLPHDLKDLKALEALAKSMETAPPEKQRAAYVSLALRDTPVGPVGAFNYSNTGLIVAAVAAERATGKPFEQLITEEVFTPLGMTHVGFGATPVGQPQGHSGGKPNAPGDGNPEFFAPAGNMYLPLGEWALFCLDQLRGAAGRGRLLKPETYTLIQSPQPGEGHAAMGWGVQDKIQGHQGPVLVHAGSDTTWFAVAALFPKTQGGVLVVANAGDSMGADKAAIAALRDAVGSVSPAVQ